MPAIAIVGAGGLGREVLFLIKELIDAGHDWNPIGFFDDAPMANSILGLPVLGSISQLPSDGNIALAIGVGTPALRYRLFELICAQPHWLPNLIHPSTVWRPEYCRLGKGNIISSHCSLTTDIQLGDANLLNTKITIGHDVIIGHANVFNPTVCVSGNVNIGDRNLFGVNAAILQGKTVGNDNTIGAGSMMMSHAGNGEMWFGVPALKM